MQPIDQYEREIETEFEGERYLVRDNGAVYRKQRPGRQKRSLDETWTFGKERRWDGYLCIGSETVHRIVAFAFHGVPPSEKHVVDHIDRRRNNNRVENLRWVTLSENVLRHPSVRKKVINASGSLESFFENPNTASKLEPSIGWLSTISKEDSEKAREQLLKWAEADGFLKGGIPGNRVLGNLQPRRQAPEPILEIDSLTPLAIQRRWKTPTEFPSCPNQLGPKPLLEYSLNLRSDSVFARDRYKESLVELAELGDGLLSVLVRFSDVSSVKPWAVTKITFENGRFVHESSGTYFELNGAKKRHYGLLGIPFSGESIDDFC